MTPAEVWWIIDAHHDRRVYGKGKTAMTEAEVRELHDAMFPAEEQDGVTDGDG